LEAAAPGVKVNVILEACQSGNFINKAPHMLSKPGRVVIASTGAYPVAYVSQSGDIVRAEDDPNVEKVALQDPDEDGIYTASHGFVEPGIYRVVIYAVDDRGLSVRPIQADHEVVKHASITPFSPVPLDRASNTLITQALS
jgi:hypothetical protein